MTTEKPELTFDWPGDQLKALAAKVRGPEWAAALDQAWIAAKNAGWSPRRAANWTCDLIFGDPADHPRDLVAATRNPLESAAVTEQDRRAASAIAAEAKEIAGAAQARWRERNRKPQGQEPAGGEQSVA